MINSGFFPHKSRKTRLLLNSCRFFSILWITFFQFNPFFLQANPTDGQVVAGGATIHESGSTLTVNQSTDKAIINWQNFSIANGELTKFVQPSVSSAVLNRVVGDNLSSIYGSLQSNGQVFLINPNGIVVGATGTINTGGFTGSTQNISNQNFLDGTFQFTGDSNAAITNLGSISANGGDIFLIADSIDNQGTLKADGTVGLAGAKDVLLAEGAERLLVRPNLAGPGSIANTGVIQGAQAELKAASGNVYALAIRNEGTIRATGSQTVNGRVLLKAQGNGLFNSGTIRATNVDGSGGSIQLAGGTSMISPSTVVVGGTLDVSAIQASEAALVAKLKGGSIQVTGQQVKIESDAHLLANGASGGGTILVGGDYQGLNPDVQNAEKTYVSSGAKLEANALVQGNGGKVVIWADQWTKYFGSIQAKGLGSGGNGGLAEVSGKQSLDYDGLVNLGSEQGQVGKLLLDPTDVTIQNVGPTNMTLAGGVFAPTGLTGSTPGVVTVGSLLSALASADVEILTNNVSGTGNGDITVADNVIYAGGTDRVLTLSAERNITFLNSIRITSSNARLDVELSADTDFNGTGTITLGNASGINSNGGDILLSGSAFDIDSAAFIIGDQVHFTGLANADFLLGSTAAGQALSDAELDTVTASKIIIENTGAANAVRLGGNVSLNSSLVDNLSIKTTNGAFDDQTLYTLSVQELEVQLGSGAMTMGSVAHDVDILKVQSAGQVGFKDANDLILQGVSSATTMFIDAGRDILVDGLVQNTSAATMSLHADSSNLGSGGVFVTSAGQVMSSGTVNLQGSAFSNFGGVGPFGGANVGKSIVIQNDGINAQVLANVAINLTGNNNNGMILNGFLSSSGNVSIDAGSGLVLLDTTINATGNVNFLSDVQRTSSTGYYTQAASIGVFGDFDLNGGVYYFTADDVNFLGGANSIHGPGSFGISTLTPNLDMTIGGTGPGLLLTNTDVAALAGTLFLTLGNGSTGNLTLNAVTLAPAFNTFASNVTIAGAFTATGSATISNTQDINVNALFTALGGGTFGADNDINIATTGGIVSNNFGFNLVADVDTNNSGSISSTGAGYISNVGTLTLSSYGTITLNFLSDALSAVSTGGNLNLSSGASSNLSVYLLNSAGTISLTGTQNTSNISLLGNATSVGDITLTSLAGLTVNPGTTITSGTGNTGTFINNGATVTGSTITAGTGTVITLNGASLDTVINSSLIQASAINLSSTRDVVVNALVQTNSGASITITADSDNNGQGGVLITTAGQVDSDASANIKGASFTNLGNSGSYSFATGYAVYVENDGTNNQIQAQGDILIQGSIYAPSANIKLAGNTESFSGGLEVHSQGLTLLAGSHTVTGGTILFDSGVTLVGTTALVADDADIEFSGALDGNFGITLAAGTGDALFHGAVGALTPLASLQVVSSDNTQFNSTAHAGTLDISADSNIGANGVLTTSTGTFTSSTVNLGTGPAHQIVFLNFNSPGGTVNYTGAGSYTVSSATASSMDLASNSGDISDGGNWDVASLNLNAPSGSAFLNPDDDGSVPTSVNYNSTLAVNETTASAYNFNGINYGGNFTLNAGGNVTQSGVVSIGGLLNINAPGRNITLNNGSNTLSNIKADGKVVTLSSSGNMLLAGGTYDTLVLSASGNITQSAAIDVSNYLSASVSGIPGAFIDLSNGGNKITSLNNVSALGNISIFEDPGFTINGSINTPSGNITIGTAGGDLILGSGSSITAYSGVVTLYTDNNVVNNGSSLYGGNGYTVYTLSDTYLGSLAFDQTTNSPTYPAPGLTPGINNLVLLSAAEPPSLDDVDTEPYMSLPDEGDIITGNEDQDGDLEGGGVVLTAYGANEKDDYVDNGDGFVGLDNFGNTQQITDVKIIILLKEALGDKAQQDLLSAIGITEEEFTQAAGGNLVTPGEYFDMSDLSSGSLASAPKALQDALSDKAKAELEALLGQIVATNGNLDGVSVTTGQVVDMASGQTLPNMPPVLVIALSSIAQFELEQAIK